MTTPHPSASTVRHRAAARDGWRLLTASEWRARQRAHHDRVDAWLGPVRDRARRGQEHPVEDFLFTYYSQRPSHLRRWSPGPGVVLADAAPEDLDHVPWSPTADGLTLAEPPERVRRTAAWVTSLCAAVTARPAQLGCFGLHEWAMVHRQAPDGVRHAAQPLRLGPDATSELVESLQVRCSHYDAYRFFTPSARPLNVLRPTRETQLELEQGGCLHANMDLYKWCYKLSPYVSSELVADTFDLARRVRELDMRASPYDLSELGYEAVPVETPEGRRQYAAAQRSFADEAATLRRRLVAATGPLLADGDA